MKINSNTPVIPIGSQVTKSTSVTPAQAYIADQIAKKDEVKAGDIQPPHTWVKSPAETKMDNTITAIEVTETPAGTVSVDEQTNGRAKRHEAKYGRDPVTGYALTKDGKPRAPRKDIGQKQGPRSKETTETPSAATDIPIT